MSARFSSILLVALLTAGGTLAACGGASPDALRAEAQAALSAGDPAKALQLADQGLTVAKGDKAAAWQLEQLRLDALAQSKQGAQVVSELERLSKDYAAQVTAPLYRSLADKAKAAGDTSGAIDILAAGDKRFPEDPTFKAAIEELKGAGMNPEEVEKLKALGYL